MTQARRGREGEAAREEERSEERQLLGVVAHNTMMGLYYPNVLSVSVHPPVFPRLRVSSPGLRCHRALNVN